MNVRDALEARHSVRAFRSDPVDPAILHRVLAAAQRAPSWCNIQPWRVWITSGEATARLTDALTAAAQAGPIAPDFPFPSEYPSPYAELRRQCGASLYSAMGIAREDKAARYDAWLRNYAAFDAPHVAIVGFDTRFGAYAALDVGCWLQSLLLAATEEGLAACAQASLATYPSAVREVLDVPKEIGILFGIALGYESPDAPANACRTDRNPVEDNVCFVGS